jgi:hypothetical protein
LRFGLGLRLRFWLRLRLGLRLRLWLRLGLRLWLRLRLRFRLRLGFRLRSRFPCTSTQNGRRCPLIYNLVSKTLITQGIDAEKLSEFIPGPTYETHGAACGSQTLTEARPLKILEAFSGYC